MGPYNTNDNLLAIGALSVLELLTTVLEHLIKLFPIHFVFTTRTHEVTQLRVQIIKVLAFEEPSFCSIEKSAVLSNQKNIKNFFIFRNFVSLNSLFDEIFQWYLLQSLGKHQTLHTKKASISHFWNICDMPMEKIEYYKNC